MNPIPQNNFIPYLNRENAIKNCIRMIYNITISEEESNPRFKS